MAVIQSSFRYVRGQTLVIRDEEGASVMWRVVAGASEGWLLERLDGEGQRILFKHAELVRLYVAGRTTHMNLDATRLSIEAKAALAREWEATPAALRTIAVRRDFILRECERRRGQFPSMRLCFEEVPAEVVAKQRVAWRLEDARLAGEERVRKLIHSRVPVHEETVEIGEFTTPAQRSLWRWYGRWIEGGRDVRTLIPRFHLRGNRTPQIKDPYIISRMEFYRDEMIMKPPQKVVSVIHDLMKKELEDEGKKSPSQKAFRVFLQKTIRDDEFVEALFGRRARHLSFSLFDETTPPDWLLQQVEVDHSFLNIHVRDDDTGRVLGRPWITMIIDRKTRVILGVHVSFLPPSCATLSRCIGHSIWPKDLSGISGLSHTWGAHGVYDWLLTDRGLDFISNSLRMTGRQVGFEIGNLPGRSPWLKGKIERLFGTLKVQAFSFLPGLTAFRAQDHYDAVKSAKIGYSELKRKILNWIVDEYHQDRHDSLGMTPIEAWNQSALLHGGVRPLKEFSDIRRLVGVTTYRQILSKGIHLDGLRYRCPELAELRGRRGGREKRWRLRLDPYDLGWIELLDDLRNIWVKVPCTRPDLSVNVTQHQHDIHKALARITARGSAVTEDDLARAKAQAEREFNQEISKKGSVGGAVRLARYREDGAFFTPVSDAPALLPAVASAVPTPALVGFGNASAASSPWPEKIKCSVGIQDEPAVVQDDIDEPAAADKDAAPNAVAANDSTAEIDLAAMIAVRTQELSKKRELV